LGVNVFRIDAMILRIMSDKSPTASSFPPDWQPCKLARRPFNPELHLGTAQCLIQSRAQGASPNVRCADKANQWTGIIQPDKAASQFLPMN
jgi:hypothetical protein